MDIGIKYNFQDFEKCEEAILILRRPQKKFSKSLKKLPIALFYVITKHNN